MPKIEEKDEQACDSRTDRLTDPAASECATGRQKKERKRQADTTFVTTCRACLFPLSCWPGTRFAHSSPLSRPSLSTEINRENGALSTHNISFASLQHVSTKAPFLMLIAVDSEGHTWKEKDTASLEI